MSKSIHQWRDRAILLHLATYNAGLSIALSKLFFEGESAGHILQRLAGQGLLEVHRQALPGRITYATLTARGLAEVSGESGRKRLAPLGPAALDQAIAISFYCNCTPVRRFRLSRRELLPLLVQATPPDNAPHIVTDEEGDPCLLRVYHATSPLSTCLKYLTQLADRLLRTPELGARIAGRDYGLLVLGPTDRACTALQRALQQTGLDRELLVRVALGPTAETLKDALGKQAST